MTVLIEAQNKQKQLLFCYFFWKFQIQGSAICTWVHLPHPEVNLIVIFLRVNSLVKQNELSMWFHLTSVYSLWKARMAGKRTFKFEWFRLRYFLLINVFILFVVFHCCFCFYWPLNRHAKLKAPNVHIVSL